MRQTENFLLNLLDASDMLSLKPLNENMEKVDAVLRAQQTSAAGKLMMATGTYTGNGSRSVTIQTPGIRPQALLLVEGSGWSAGRISLWIGTNMDIDYIVTAATEEGGEQFRTEIRATIRFQPDGGQLSWTIPQIPSGYYDVTTDEGPYKMYNSNNMTYRWIAFGTAE